MLMSQEYYFLSSILDDHLKCSQIGSPSFEVLNTGFVILCSKISRLCFIQLRLYIQITFCPNVFITELADHYSHFLGIS